MNTVVFSTWLTRQGFQVIQSKSSSWYNAGPHVLQAFPYHWLIRPDEDEIKDLLVSQGNLALRYSTALDSEPGMVSYHVILNQPYTLDMLRSQARNGVKRGLENCRIEQISFERLASEGWVLQQDTLIRQNRAKSMKKEEWERICLAAADLAEFEAWASVVDGNLAACLLIARVDDVFCVPFAICHHQYLNLHVNNALFFTVSCDLLSRPGVREIFYSLHSLDAPESVNEFKFRMGFEARPVRQRVALHPLIKPVANHFTFSLLSTLLKGNPDQPFLSKMEGILRFYRDGLVPLNSQIWPESIADKREETMGKILQSIPGGMISIAEGVD
jgi:hypothetical protein